MGCGSSKAASASDLPVEPDALKKKGRSKLEDARGVGISGVDATAAVTVAAGCRHDRGRRNERRRARRAE